MSQRKPATELERRSFLAYFAGIGLGSTLLPGALWARLQQESDWQVTPAMLEAVEQIAGLEFTPEEREAIAAGVTQNVTVYQELRRIPLINSDWPAMQPPATLPGMSFETRQQPFRLSPAPPSPRPADLEEVAFWPVTRLAELLRTGRVRSMELTEMYLTRLRRFDPKLECVITLTEDLARRQAARADAEIQAGNYRGPLHGIPWGVKDLMATQDYPTTWGAAPYRNQQLGYDATVVKRLEQAGAVLIAKLSTGALASGDIWFGGQTKTPWNLSMGTRGSSAGPGAATAAGLVAFALGTETRGSIVFPATRCGLTGLRPSFGRVSRYGVMAISFSMDKVGPMCRSVEDCALVFDAIRGVDGKDTAVMDLPFNWAPESNVRGLKVGYVAEAFEAEQRSLRSKENDQATLQTLRDLGVKLEPVQFPDYPVDVHRLLLYPEAAAAFDELVRSRRDAQLVRQEAWPRRLRMARAIPAVEYIQADRIRLKIMREMADLMSRVDVLLAPPSEPGTPITSPLGKNTPLTNLTGNPCVVLPNGFQEDDTPTSITMVGRLHAESEILALARLYQEATDFHLQHPEEFV